MRSPENQLLISATTSQRRNESLKQLPNIDLLNHPGPDPEPDYNDTSQVAKAKSEYLHSLIESAFAPSSLSLSLSLESDASNSEEMRILTPALLSIITAIAEHGEVFKVIAADSRTETFENPRGRDLFVSHGKPKDEEEFANHIHNMSKTGRAMYRVLVGSHLADYSSEQTFPVETRDRQLISVRLKPETLRILGTDAGLQHYLDAFNEFYASETYKKNGLTQATKITDLSSGFSLPVLIQEKMVEAVGFDQKPQSLELIDDRLLKQLIYGVAAGYSPRVLDQVLPGSYDLIIDNWAWLSDVIKHVKK